MQPDLEKNIKEIAALIQSGMGHKAREQLRLLLKQKKIARKWLADIAQLCWRANLPEEGLRLLYPVIHPSDREVTHPSSQETAEYGVSLIKAGATDEGILALQSVDKEQYPAALLYEAFGLIARWDYAKSIALLLKFASHGQISAYQRLVCNVNLVAAYVFTSQFEEANSLLTSWLKETEKGALQLARARLLQLQSEILIAQKRFSEAGKSLAEADSCLADKGSIDHFFIRKYQAVIDFQKGKSHSTRPLDDIETEARQLRHWETVRDVHKIKALSARDPYQLSMIFFGTPYEAFCEVFTKQLPSDIKIAETFDWSPQEIKASTGPVQDLQEETWKGKRLTSFKVGMANHRLLSAFSSDFFRPFTVARLFSHQFPEEIYIPRYSAKRVKKAVSRLRQFLAENEIPLEIIEGESEFSLQAQAPILIRLRREAKPTYRVNEMIARLKKEFPPSHAFTSQEVAEKLGLSQRMAQRILSHSVYSYEIQKSGKGKQTTYRFKVA